MTLRFSFTALVALLAVSASAQTAAPVATNIPPASAASASSEKSVFFGLQGNWSDPTGFGFGARVAFDFDKYVSKSEIVTTFDYFMPDSAGDLEDESMGVWSSDESYFSWNLNFVRKFELDSTSAQPYVGAGLNIARYKLALEADWSAIGGEGSTAVDGSETTAGVDILAGILFKKHFFAEARYEINSVGVFVITAGARF